MNKFITIITLLVSFYPIMCSSEVFFNEAFELDTGDKVFGFSSYNGNRTITQDRGSSNPRQYDPTYVTGERIYDANKNGYVWKNTFHQGCNDTYFGHRVALDANRINTNTLHWRAYVKFGDSDDSAEWLRSEPTNTPDCPSGKTERRGYELKFPDVGAGTGRSRVIGKFMNIDEPGYQGRFLVFTREDGVNGGGSVVNHPQNAQDIPLFVSNRWYAVEFMLEDNGNTDTVNIWINNNDPDNPDYSYTSVESMFDFSTMVTATNDGDRFLRWEHGYRNHDVPRDTNFYYDDVVISDSFIGTGGSDIDPNSGENSYVVINPALKSAAIMSLVDNNVITAGELSLNLDLYESGIFYSSAAPVLSQGMVITGSGPFDIGSGTNGTDMPVHASMLGTSFAMPHTRFAHSYSMLSPNDDAVVNISVNGEHRQVVIPHGEVSTFDAGSANGAFGAVITSDVPIYVSHQGHDSGAIRDASPMPPATTELWGVRTTNAYVTAVEDDTHVTMYASNGDVRTMTLHTGQKRAASVGLSSRQGLGSAIHLVADKPISAVQQADGDGIEQTAFYPTHMLNQRFGVPKDSQYIAVVCTEPDTTVTLYRPNANSVSENCTTDGEHPGKLFFGSADNGVVAIAQGSYLESTKPIHVIYEVTGSEDEHNLMGTSVQP